VRRMVRRGREGGEEDGIAASESEESKWRSGMRRMMGETMGSDSEDSSMGWGWMKVSESEESMRELRGREGSDGLSESSDW